jgi:hypothetical protein
MMDVYSVAIYLRSSERKLGFFHHFLSVVFVFFTLFAGVKAQDTVETYTADGTFTVPQGVTTITVEAWGAGGGGGTRTSDGEAGGGGGGAYAKSVIPVVPEGSYPVVVGTGGNSGTNGGSSSFDGTTVVAAGGIRGTNNNSTGGAGGSAGNSTGDVVYAGGNGADAGYTSNGWWNTYYSGGGGGAAGSTGNGKDASGQTGGAATDENGGSGANGVTNSSDGKDGSQYGGGGSGARRNWEWNSRSGGSGADGFVRITYTPPYRAEFGTISAGSSIWEFEETRTVSVTVTNTGQAVWNAANGISVGVKWNGDTYTLEDGNGLTQGETATYSFSVTAPSLQGANNLTFGIINSDGAFEEKTSEELTIVPSLKAFYSYKTGEWNDLTTWTHDPSGTTQACESLPESYNEVYILSGREVRLSADVNVSDLDVTIKEGGVLDLGTDNFSAGLRALRGQGTLKIASAVFPFATTNTFVKANGGTTEYYSASNFTLPSTQQEFNNLVINESGITATQKNDIHLNGDLFVKAGTFRINDNSSTSRLSLEIDGAVNVNSGGAITVGTGNTVSGNTSGGTAPFTNYYNSNSHRVVVNGDFTNNGTVRFTNQSAPGYNSFPNNGFATVYFVGASDNTLYCNGKTDFYNLVLDKGSDQTFKLTVKSTAYSNFRLFGRNDQGGEGGTANPNLRKALWLRTGTMILDGIAIIPSLTEASAGGSPNGDFYIPANAALVIDGPEVIVLTTADSYKEINAAYGTSVNNNSEIGVRTTGGTQSFSVYGRLRLNDGYFSTRESGGIITWDYASGQLEIAGGYLDAKQIRAAGGSTGLASYNQTGGTVALRGRFQRIPAQYNSANDLKATSLATINTTRKSDGLNGGMGTFNINASENVFMMSGGTIQIYDVCGSNDYAVDIFSAKNNINVTGGTFEFLPLDGNDQYKVRSAAPFGNFLVNRGSASSAVVTLNDNYPLTVLKNIDLSSGDLDANDLDVTVGGDFSVAADGTYNSGTNTTLFDGGQDQLFTISGTVNNSNDGLNNLTINKSGGSLSLNGDKNNLTVQGSFDLTKGTFDDGGKILYVAGNVTNSGTHTGDGEIQLNGSTTQTIGGDGTGVFKNLKLNNNSSTASPVSLIANTSVTGTLTFSKAKNLNIDTYNLKLEASAAIAGTGTDRFIETAGNAGDGGVTIKYNSDAARTFPVGVEYFTPATLGFSASPDSYGTITVTPVNYAHPVVKTANVSLKYFWRVKSDGFTNYEGKVAHSFIYNQSDVSGNENNYIPALYDAESYEWNQGVTSDIDKGNNTISDWTSPGASANFIDGDYTAGVATAFVAPEKFYSRQSGNWNNRNTWSNTGHGGNRASRIPEEGDIVIIGAGHTVSLERTETDNWWTGKDERDNKNEDIQNCGTLQIEAGGVLDVKYSPASNFGMILSHPNGNGLIRVSTAYSSGSTFEFPEGDFTEFNANLGTTELYTINTTSGTTYWLPNDVTSYGNLIISPAGGSNIIFGNTDVTIYGDLTTQGQSSESWFLPTWDSDYPTTPTQRIAKTITIKGDFNIQGGALVYYGNRNRAQDFIVEGSLVVSEGAGIQIYRNANDQSINIGGDLINNASFGNGQNAYAGCDFTGIPVTFFGDNDAKITNTSGTPDTQFETVTVNKGNSQSTTLTIDIAGNLDIPEDDWLTLQNGTLEYKRVNPNSDFTITTQSTFTIPSTAGLYVDYDNSNSNRVLIANASSDNNDLYLNGKLTVVKGDVYVGAPGSPNNNNDIEYAGGGASAVDVRGGALTVNGQIRRNPATTSGILSYAQSGGSVTIYGRNANTTNAKLEVLNSGSEFDMSGGTLTIVRGGGGNSYGDLFLRPESSDVTGGEIVFENQSSGGEQSYLLDATVPLNNLTVTGYSGNNATVTLLVSPLTLKGDLTIDNSNSIFDANSEFDINLTIKGDLINNGIYNHYSNLTTFNGGEQIIKGSSVTDFYDLTINPVTSVSLIRGVTVQNDLNLTSGQLLVAANTVTVEGDLINNATYSNDDGVGGIVLSGVDDEHQISGTGTFGRLELNSAKGARLLNDVSLEKNFILTNGILNINKYLLKLGANSEIEGSGFGNGKMISSDGVYSSKGIMKYFPVISGNTTFTYPMGIAGKYTPFVIDISQNNNLGSVRVNTINDKHPSAQSPYRVLNYYWEVESSGIIAFKGDLKFFYDDNDVMQTASDEADYIAARLLTPKTKWAKFSTSEVDENNNEITINIGSGADDISGEYTAGVDGDIPDEVPVYESVADGDWTDADIWQPVGSAPVCPAGGPNGAVVIINNEVTTNANYCNAYKTTINGELIVDNATYGHNLGTIDGDGTLHVEGALMPAGRYDDFLGCGNNSTLEFGGNDDYNIVADLFTSIANLKVSGTGIRVLPNKDLTICNSLVIDGAKLDNSVNNKALIIKGTMERYNNGRFIAGSGSGAIVHFTGDAVQTIGGSTGNFTGNNAFNNLEIDNANGLTVEGATEVSGILMLTNGLINTTGANPLTITNTAGNSVSPAGGSKSSYVNGPLVKRINQGDSFNFPVGKDGNLGNKFILSATQSGTIDWTVEYFTPNSTYANYTNPLTYVNSKEYWKVSAPSGSQARVSVNWDSSSDVTPLITVNGTDDLLVAEYDTSVSEWTKISSIASGNNSIGTVTTSNRVSVPVSGDIDFTTATLNNVKPKAKLTPDDEAVCGTSSGIQVTFTSPDPITFNYTLNYSIDGVAQTPVTVSSVPFILPTPKTGDYQLTGFAYDDGNETGVVDESVVAVYAIPTAAQAGDDQSHCGASSTVLEGSNPLVGTGLWKIISGDGGNVEYPTMAGSSFSGTNGSSYTLTWKISNGKCLSVDTVVVTFPVLAEQPGAFKDYDAEVCQGEENVVYSVPNDETIAKYNWSYSGSGVTFNSTSNSVSLSFGSSSTGGTLSVTAENNCGASEARTIDITVNETTSVTLKSDISGTLCKYNNPTFTAVPGTGPTVNYQFFVDGNSKQQGASASFEPYDLLDSQIVNVVATTAKGCQSISNDITVSVIETDGLWVGTADSDWSNVKNWCSGVVPADGGDVTISGTRAHTPEIAADIELSNLTIESGGDVVLKQGTMLNVTNSFVNNGDVILKSTPESVAALNVPEGNTDSGHGKIELSELQDNQWYRLGQPINNPVAQIYEASLSTSWIYRSTTHWERITSDAESLNPMEGIMVLYEKDSSGTHTVAYEGTLNTGEMTWSIPYGKGYYLFANPYPGVMKWAISKTNTKTGVAISDNLSPTIYYRIYAGSWIGDDYLITYNGLTGISTLVEGGNLPGDFTDTTIGNISPMQSVWVEVEDSNTATIKVDNQARISGNPLPLKSASADSDLSIIKIVQSNDLISDVAVVCFGNDFQAGKDRGDSPKKFNSSENVPEIFTREENTSLAINALPALTEEHVNIPMSVRIREKGTITISMILDDFVDDYDVFLEDTKLGIIADMLNTDEYSFEWSNSGYDHDRFVLHLDKASEVPTDITTPEDGNTSAIEITGQGEYALVKINSSLLNGHIATIDLLDIRGRSISTRQTDGTETEVELPGNNGVYIIRVSVGDRQKIGKVVAY